MVSESRQSSVNVAGAAFFVIQTKEKGDSYFL